MSYIPLPTDVNNNVMTRLSQHDMFDQIVMSARSPQISANFFTPNTQVSDFMNVSITGSGTTAMSGGKASFSSGTDTSASVSATTVTNINYTPGFEVYAMFTTTFTTPTSANSTQFVGLWDVSNNGFYIGYNGTTFGSAVMTGGVQTFTARSSWNGDPLDGSATSKFTRNGVPEAINFTYLNLFRIRFGWLGAAPVLFEVCSPDGNWVTFNTIIQPNTSASPSIQNPNLPLTLRITKASADATNLTMTCACWAAGTSAPNNVSVSNYVRQQWTSATASNSTIVANTVGATGISITTINSGTISAGAVTFEVTPDGINWFELDVSNLPNTLTASTYSLSTGSSTWQGYIAGYIQTRARLSTAITGSGTVVVEIRPTLTASNNASTVFQPTGTNLHTVVDSGTVTITTSTSGSAPTAASVGVASAQVLAANSSRKGAVFTNTSANTISIGVSGNAAVLNSGITLTPGGIWVMDQYTFTTGAITAIASGASSNLAIQEFV